MTKVRRQSRRWCCGVVAALAVITIAGSGFGHALPETTSTEQALAHYIADGVPAGPEAAAISDCGAGGTGAGQGSGDCSGGSGSSSGSSGGFATDTTGYGPPATAWIPAFGYGLLHPDLAPPGTNDWNCEPSAAHPRPVIAVHGTWMNAYNAFAYMGQPLRDAGFCVYTFNYGRATPLQGGGVGSLIPGLMGTGYIQESADQLAAFVDRVLGATGADEVDIVAHSQGGPMANWYLKFDDGAAKVDNLITFGATHHGTTLIGMGTLARAVNDLGVDVLGFGEIFVGHAGAQQIIGSDFLHTLNADGDTAPGVDYTVVGTRYDEITTPFDSTFLRAGPGATVNNIVLQDGCESDLSDHVTLMYSPRALSIVLRAIDPAGHPELVCTFNPWLVGGGGSL